MEVYEFLHEYDYENDKKLDESEEIEVIDNELKNDFLGGCQFE